MTSAKTILASALFPSSCSKEGRVLILVCLRASLQQVSSFRSATEQEDVSSAALDQLSRVDATCHRMCLNEKMPDDEMI